MIDIADAELDALEAALSQNPEDPAALWAAIRVQRQIIDVLKAQIAQLDEQAEMAEWAAKELDLANTVSMLRTLQAHNLAPVRH